MINKVVIFGSNRLAQELFRAFEEENNYSGQVVLNDLSHVESADVVIETTNVIEEEKKANLQDIESRASADTVVLTTALQWSSTEVASWLKHPERLIGFAAFCNFKDGELIEVAPALQSNSAYLSIAEDVFASIGMTIEVVQDEPGLVYPRILSMIINEAAFALMENTAQAEDIDTAMKKGTNYPLGPLEWAEKVGIDDIYAVLSGLHRELGEERYRPAPLIRKLVYAGWLGEESDKGFYHYQNRKTKELVQ